MPETELGQMVIKFQDWSRRMTWVLFVLVVTLAAGAVGYGIYSDVSSRSTQAQILSLQQDNAALLGGRIRQQNLELQNQAQALRTDRVTQGAEYTEILALAAQVRALGGRPALALSAAPPARAPAPTSAPNSSAPPRPAPATPSSHKAPPACLAPVAVSVPVCIPR